MSDTRPERSSSIELLFPYFRRMWFTKTGGASAPVCHSCASLRGNRATGVSPCQCRSEPLLRPNLSLGQKKSILKELVAVVLKKVLKKDPQALYNEPIDEIYTLDKCKLFMRQLAMQLDRVLQYNSRVILSSVKEGSYSDKECQQFVLEWAAELSTLDDKHLRQTAVEGSYRDPPRERNPEEQREDTDLRSQMQDHKLQKAQNILLKWTTSKDPVHLPEDVCSILQDLERQWKRGKLSSTLPVMDFIMWAVIQEQSEEGSAAERWLRTRQRFRTSASLKYIPDFTWNWIVEAQAKVTLDQKTANPDLILSEDRKSVKMDTIIESRDKHRDGFCKVRHQYDGWCCVQGTEGFTTGRHYWEVDVKRKRDWRIGVVKESAPRRGFVSLNTQSGYWTLRLQLGELIALTVPLTKFPEVVIPSKVGVYLDVEEGQLSFYDAERRSHIYTFNDTFTEKVYPVFGTIETDKYLVIL
ncbi:E3 ubiquitin-protein ligase TRIM39-like [Scleropages formosus]|uniref:E3 ubiquitin-protein ligase TRIM39-like n=1 Tax=Scleropages formosus TaxID=113540 RepID=A0A8C9TGU6_SCLFO|nr:E3 ubiquitin-protein ligase TRIM39-like [Scleropages formosus]